jgi:GTPase SAR1 family protein
MRIAVIGTACVGKSTFINDFLENWKDVYKTPESSYRDIITDSKLPHSKSTTKETQQAILNNMIEQHMKYGKNDRVIFDRCPIDNLIYSLHSYDTGVTDIDDKFIEESIPLVKESMRFLDLLLYIPWDENVMIKEDGFRETDRRYIEEIDNLFKQVEAYSHQDGSIFFHDDDKPAVIRITGAPRERIRQASLYITDTGDNYKEEDCDIDWQELSQFGIEPTDVFPQGKL